jgi:uncharacterized protein YkwD
MAARSTLLVLAASALLAAGCGSSDDAAAPVPLPLGPGATLQPVTGARAVETTDGRLGGATTARPGARIEELSRGGRPDVRRHADGERRDGVGAGASCADQELAPTPASLPAMAASQLCLLNGVRADAGLPPLTLNAKLTAAATAYAQDLVAGGYFSHTGRDGSTIRTRLDAVGYLPDDAGWAIGENLAWGTGPLAMPGSIMQAWMNSEGHRKNMLNPEYREIGIGVVVGNPARADGSGATYANAFGVVDEAEAEPAPVADREPAAKPAKKKVRKGRKGNRRKGGRHKGNKAGISARHAKKGKGRIKRGPRARIAI